MSKVLAAFLLGLFSFFLFMAIGEAATYYMGEAAGLLVDLVLMAVYFFICQFLLSRGHPNAYRKDWLIMLALVSVPLVLVFVMVLVESREVVMFQGVGMLIACCGGTLAGAAVATTAARRSTGRR